MIKKIVYIAISVSGLYWMSWTMESKANWHTFADWMIAYTMIVSPMFAFVTGGLDE